MLDGVARRPAPDGFRLLRVAGRRAVCELWIKPPAGRRGGSRQLGRPRRAKLGF
jgi:hypothetical protein